MISVNMRGPEGATFEFIRDYADRIEQIADSIAPEKQSIMTRSWEGGGSLNLILSDIKERERSQMEIAETLSKEVRKETLADRKSTRLNSSHANESRMPSSA